MEQYQWRYFGTPTSSAVSTEKNYVKTMWSVLFSAQVMRSMQLQVKLECPIESGLFYKDSHRKSYCIKEGFFFELRQLNFQSRPSVGSKRVQKIQVLV